MEKRLISKEGVKAFFHKAELRVSEEVYELLEEELRIKLAKVAKRTAANKRSTVLTFDL